MIKNSNWSTLISEASNVSVAAENFTIHFLKCVRECIPEKTITVRPKDKPWFDSTLRKTIRIRDRLRNIAMKTNKIYDWSKYKKVRNQVNNMKKQAFSNYYDNIETFIDDSSKSNYKLYWKLLQDVFQTKTTSEIPPLQYTDDKNNVKTAFSDVDKTEVLNKYFSSISNILTTGKVLPELYLQCDETLDNIFIEEFEVTDIISVLPVNKAIGPDSISHKMLKSTMFTICKPLCLLFNKSLSERSFPDCWKMAHVLPLFEKEDPSLSCNYRPVSLLSCVSKII